MNKKFLFIFIIIFVFIYYFIKHYLPICFLKSTDLSNLKINNISIGENVNDIDLSIFEKNYYFKEKKYTKYFNDFRISYNKKGIILKLKTLENENLNNFYNSEIYNLNDVKDNFGNNYIKKTFDSDQSLDCIIYYDKINKLRAIFIYPNNSSNYDYPDHKISIVWVALEKYKFLNIN